jgi:hypothetical protein
MKRHMENLKHGALVAVVFALTLSTPGAWAGSKVFTSSSTTISGSVETNANGNVDPFVVQVFSTGGECVRLAVDSQGADLEMTLVSPSGLLWQDDDSNGGLRPLIKAITDARGWYVLILSHFSGASTNADFSLSYGRFVSTSAQCSPPTSPHTADAATNAAEDMKPVDSGTLMQGPTDGPNAP